MKVVLDQRTLQNIAAFQQITRARVIDCLENEIAIFFVVEKGMRILALGVRGERLERLQRIFGKKVRVIEYSENLEEFVRNLVPEAQKIEIADKLVRIRVSKYHRPRVIGKDKRNLMIIQGFLKRLFNIEEVKVL